MLCEAYAKLWAWHVPGTARGAPAPTPEVAPPPAQPSMVRQGRWGNSRVLAPQAARGAPGPEGAEVSAIPEPPSRADRRAREDAEAIGGMRGPLASLDRVGGWRPVGRRMGNCIEACCADTEAASVAAYRLEAQDADQPTRLVTDL